MTAMLYYILQDNYPNQGCILLETRLPYIISRSHITWR